MRLPKLLGEARADAVADALGLPVNESAAEALPVTDRRPVAVPTAVADALADRVAGAETVAGWEMDKDSVLVVDSVGVSDAVDDVDAEAPNERLAVGDDERLTDVVAV